MALDLQPLNVIMLSAGFSSRMGTPKHMKPYTNNEPYYIGRFKMLHQAIPSLQNTYLTVRLPSEQEVIYSPPGLHVETLIPPNAHLGPAAGLVAAYHLDPTAHWLVSPNDYPLLTMPEIQRLVAEYREPVTVFENGRGKIEPWASLWGPEALKVLSERFAAGDADATRVVEDLGGKRVRPLWDYSLFNANNGEDWEHAMGLLGGK
jgi:molybdopterin-guanine dinucleotide biosynthesis protein A